MALRDAPRPHVYLAYLGRPVDAYSAFGDTILTSRLRSVTDSPEYAALQSMGSTLQNIYQRLFNRAAEASAVAYWSGEVTTGRLTEAELPLAILQGAQNADRLTVDNKLAAVAAFTAALDTPFEHTNYAGAASAAAARAWLQNVTSDPATLAAAVSGAPAAVLAATAQSQPPGARFTLTAQTDTIDGTTNSTDSTGFVPSPGNDQFFAGPDTLGAADRLDGLGGMDTLVIDGAGSLDTTGYTVSNIEQLFVTGNRPLIDLSGLAGLQSAWVQAHGIATLRGLASSVQLTVAGYTGADLTVQFTDRDTPGVTRAVFDNLYQNEGTRTTLHLPGVERLLLKGWNPFFTIDAPSLSVLDLYLTDAFTGTDRILNLPGRLQVNVDGAPLAGANRALSMTGLLPDAGAIDMNLSGGVWLSGVVGINVESITSTGSGMLYLSFQGARTAPITVNTHGTGGFNLDARGLDGITATGSEHVQNQLIGSTGVDVFTGGRVAGGDSFTFRHTDFNAATAGALAARPDVIHRWGTGRDFVRDDGVNVTVVDNATAAAGVARIVAGFATFDRDGTLAEKISWTEAGINAGGTAAAGQAAAFLHDGDRYLFFSNGVDGVNAGDALVRLVGVQSTAGLTLGFGGVVAGDAEQVAA